jgi:hypothetical protein
MPVLDPPRSTNGGASVEGASPPAEMQAEERSAPTDPTGVRKSARVARHIPDSMWKGREDDLRLYLQRQLSVAEGERREKLRNFARWKEAYAAPRPDQPKHFPIWNASNLTVPVIKETVNTIVSQVVQATLTNRPYWHFQDLDPDWDKFIYPIERFLDLAAERDLGIDSVDSEVVDWITEACKLGTSILEVGHEVEVRGIYEYTEDGTGFYKREYLFSDGPKVYRVPLSRFWIRNKERDIQRAPWVGKTFSKTVGELRAAQRMGKYYGVERIEGFLRTKRDDEVENTTEEIYGDKELQAERVEIFEIYLKYDVDGDGQNEDIRVYFHRDSGTFIGRQFNPFNHKKRPFVKLGYFPVEDSFYDDGLCSMLEQIQEGVSTKHNQRSDNATMANLKMLIKRKMLRNLQPGDPLYTGKIIEANDIWNDVREFSMSEIYPSTIHEEEILRRYGDRLSGMNEAVAGSAMPVSRTTASAQLALLQEQMKRIDLTVRHVRKGFNQVGRLTVSLYSQFGTGGKAIAWLGEQGKIVDAVFRLPKRVDELGMGIRAQVPTSAMNKSIKRENAVGMFNLLVQLYERMLPLAEHLAPEHLGEVAHGMVSSSHKFMAEVLESFDLSDPEGVLEGISVLERVLPAPEDLGGLEPFRRRVESSEIIERLSRMEDTYRQAETARDRDNGLSPFRGQQRATAPPQGDGGRQPADGRAVGVTPNGR